MWLTVFAHVLQDGIHINVRASSCGGRVTPFQTGLVEPVNVAPQKYVCYPKIANFEDSCQQCVSPFAILAD